MFATSQYRDWCFYALPMGPQHRIPLMHMPYIGALKSWLYTPILALLPPTPAVLRLPAVLMGSAAILLLWILLNRLHGRRAAWIGCVLLTTDTTFLLTTTFDWGPVALQHLLAVAAMLMAVRWYQSGGTWWLAGSAFCCGLGLWDKAVFIWVLCGLCGGALLFSRNIWRRVKWHQLALAAAALCIGALPLIAYNLTSTPRFATFGSAERFHPRDFPLRVGVLRGTWNGSGLFALFVNDDSASHPKSARGVLERASVGLHTISGDHRTNAIEPAMIVGLLLLPVLWRTRARNTMLYCLAAAAAAWLVMLYSGGGLFVHHSVLLWPLPQMFLGVALAEASQRVRFGTWAVIVTAGVLVVANVLVTNQYLYQFIRNGARERWSDAMFALAGRLRDEAASVLVFPDWGILDSICVLNRNHPPTRLVSDPLTQSELDLLADEKAIWVEHTTGNEIETGVNDRVLAAANAAGFAPVRFGEYTDSNGRPVFQTLRFVRRAPIEPPK